MRNYHLLINRNSRKVRSIASKKKKKKKKENREGRRFFISPISQWSLHVRANYACFIYSYVQLKNVPDRETHGSQ